MLTLKKNSTNHSFTHILKFRMKRFVWHHFKEALRERECEYVSLLVYEEYVHFSKP